MKKSKIILLGVMIVLMFIIGGCTGDNTASNPVEKTTSEVANEDVQDNIIILKKYSLIQLHYDHLEFIIDILMEHMDTFRDSMANVIRSKDADTVEYLKSTINNYREHQEMFIIDPQEIDSLMDIIKNDDINVSDMNDIVSNIEQANEFLENANVLAEEYIETEVLSDDVVKMAANINIQHGILKKDRDKSRTRKLDFFNLIQNYN